MEATEAQAAMTEAVAMAIVCGKGGASGGMAMATVCCGGGGGGSSDGDNL